MSLPLYNLYFWHHHRVLLSAGDVLPPTTVSLEEGVQWFIFCCKIFSPCSHWDCSCVVRTCSLPQNLNSKPHFLTVLFFKAFMDFRAVQFISNTAENNSFHNKITFKLPIYYNCHISGFQWVLKAIMKKLRPDCICSMLWFSISLLSRDLTQYWNLCHLLCQTTTINILVWSFTAVG